MLDLADKDFKAIITNEFKELKENMIWKSKERKILQESSWKFYTCKVKGIMPPISRFIIKLQ